MPSRGQPVRLGPFAGGINTLSDPAALDDTELIDIINFELDLDGSLLSRPPAVSIAGPAAATTRMILLCWGFFGGNAYLIGSNSQGIWYYTNNTWTLITSTIQSRAAVQYADKIWIVATPASANPGGTWSPSGGWVPIAAQPKGTCILTFKERLYITGDTAAPSTIFFSDAPPNQNQWQTGVNNINANLGDGEIIVEIIIYNDGIVIFKNNSTYVYSFDTNPTAGTLRRISGTIGCTDKNCVVLYEQALYVLDQGNVYEMVNADFERLNTKVPFTYDGTTPVPFEQPVAISLFGDRLIIRYYARIYAFGFRTRTWTRWITDRYFCYFLHQPSNPTGNALETYIAGSCQTIDTKIYRVRDGLEPTSSEAMQLYIKSKIYDLAISARYKRLFWWGVDINTVHDVTGKVTPITYIFTVTWGQLSPLKWNQLQTWAQPTAVAPTSTTTIATGAGGVRRFLKFLKSIRFRQVQYEILMSTNGTPSDAPARLFNMTAFVATRETVSKAVS